MKKLLGFIFALVAVLSLASCGGKVEGALSYDEYVAAKDDTEVTIAGYVQARQSWWTDEAKGVSQATFYLQDKDGGYFVYNLPCTEEQYNNDLAKLQRAPKNCMSFPTRIDDTQQAIA